MRTRTQADARAEFMAALILDRRIANLQRLADRGIEGAKESLAKIKEEAR